MRPVAPPPLPRQHGAWVMLSLPLLFGLVLTGGRSAAAWMALPAFGLAFLANDALVQGYHAGRRAKAAPREYVRRRTGWGIAYLGGAGASFLTLLGLAPAGARPEVLAVALAAAVAAAAFGVDSLRHRGRALWSELIGMAGMSLGAPLMAAAAGRNPLGLPLGAAAMAYGYCLSSVTFVRTYERKAPVTCMTLHVVLLAAIALLVGAGTIPHRGWLAFVPVAARTVLGLAWPPRNLRQLGLRELWVAVSFAALSVWSLLSA